MRGAGRRRQAMEIFAPSRPNLSIIVKGVNLPPGMIDTLRGERKKFMKGGI